MSLRQVIKSCHLWDSALYIAIQSYCSQTNWRVHFPSINNSVHFIFLIGKVIIWFLFAPFKRSIICIRNWAIVLNTLSPTSPIWSHHLPQINYRVWITGYNFLSWKQYIMDPKSWISLKVHIHVHFFSWGIHRFCDFWHFLGTVYMLFHATSTDFFLWRVRTFVLIFSCATWHQNKFGENQPIRVRLFKIKTNCQDRHN